MGNGLPDRSVNALAIDPRNSNHVYVGTDNGVYSSTDGGLNWTAYGTGLPPVAVFDMQIQDPFRVLRVATHGRGFYEIPTIIPPVLPISAASVKTHTGLGPLSIPLALTGSPTVECRAGQPAVGSHQIVINFAAPVTFTGAAVTSGSGAATTSPPPNSAATTQVTVNITGAADQQYITVTLFGVNDGTNTSSVGIRMGLLFGDIDGTAVVDGNDVSAVQGLTRQSAAANPRGDINLTGLIDGNDVSLTQQQTRHAIP
ncbi:MAG: hypothetical protein M3128_07025 [Verrucomicrobiota bacterium]|nr:hypothetical protein [Verrucomicrobiota bacterium]